jgi:hypothetical protein
MELAPVSDRCDTRMCFRPSADRLLGPFFEQRALHTLLLISDSDSARTRHGARGSADQQADLPDGPQNNPIDGVEQRR